jgi:hypothetical protein
MGGMEINTIYAVMPMIHWCDDKGHFYVEYSPANVPKLGVGESMNT